MVYYFPSYFHVNANDRMISYISLWPGSLMKLKILQFLAHQMEITENMFTHCISVCVRHDDSQKTHTHTQSKRLLAGDVWKLLN